MAALFSSTFYMGDLRYLAGEYRKLPPALAKKHLRAAIKRAANPFLPAFRACAPRGRTGNLKKSPIVVADFDRVSGNWTARVGYGMGKKRKGYAALLVNNGTKERKHKRQSLFGKRHRTGRGPATHFADGVLASTRSAGLAGLETQLYAALEKATAELPRYLAAKKR